jgi:hypothetical protein
LDGSLVVCGLLLVGSLAVAQSSGKQKAKETPLINSIHISGEEQLPSGHGTSEMPVWGPIFSHVLRMAVLVPLSP